jgi:NAD(P)-dependent dehydrogenase (short-subunit alcohol dehydrogenase family)
MTSDSSRRILVTGPTAGIGRQIAFDLATPGTHLVLGCRDLTRGERVAGELRRMTRPDAVSVLRVDTSDQGSIRAFARAYRDAHPRLDVLVNNAGLAQGERTLSVDGLELTFATNVLGYFLLTCELLDVLVPSRPARIVNVASAFASNLELDDLQFERRPYDGLRAYAQSKACNRLLTWALARRLKGSGVTANAYAPGFVAGTELSRDLPPAIREAYRERVGRTAVEGADTAVWLATDPALEGVSGQFFMDRRRIPCELRDESVEERLWTTCERLVGAACSVPPGDG